MRENQKYIYRLIDREEAETQDSEEREMNTREQSPVEEGRQKESDALETVSLEAERTNFLLAQFIKKPVWGTSMLWGQEFHKCIQNHLTFCQRCSI